MSLHKDIGMSFLRYWKIWAKVLIICSGSYLQANAAEPTPMTPVDMVELTRLSLPALSPNGAYLIYRRSQADWEEDKELRRYVLRDLNAQTEVPIFKPESDESFGRAYWSPDSQGFLTLLKRKSDAKNSRRKQAWYYNIQTRQFSMLTSEPDDVQDIEWATDGSGFYFRTDKIEPVDERPKSIKKIATAIKPYDSPNALEVRFFDLESSTTTPIVAGDFFIRGYDVSNDGERILYSKASGGLSRDRHSGELWLRDLSSDEERQITDNNHAESRASLSPDSTKIAYISTVNEKGEGYYEDNLFVVDIETGNTELILPKLPMEVQNYAWAREKASIFILGNTGLRSQLYKYNFAYKTLAQLTHGDHAVKNWRYDGGLDLHIFTLDSAKNPGDIYTLNSEGDITRLTDEYTDFNARKALPKQEAFHWRGRGGQKLEGLLVYPLNYVAGEAFPLVTITHGGPRSSSQFGAWNVSRAVSVYAGQGYGVFLPNHRGGTGYGDKFMRDMVGGYFTNADKDVMSGIDALIEDGLADPDQLLKQGWSAGGHMVNWLITETDRFKAASSGAGAADWVSMYGESDVRHNRTYNFGGTPWQKRAPLKTYQKQSPLYQSHKITTPTLFWAGENDVRVPPTQSILMHRGAKAAGAKTELYIAKGEPHNFRKLSHRLFKINTELAWYAKYLGQDIPEAEFPDEVFYETASD